VAGEPGASRCDFAGVVILVVEVSVGCLRGPPPGPEVGDESVTQILGGRSFRVWLLRDFE
jgi:hypothetical protein